MTNPLLSQGAFPTFSSIVPEQHIEPAIKIIIEENRRKLDELLSGNTAYNWDNLLAPLEEMNDKLSKAWSPVSHLHAVAESEALRAAYNACLPLLTEYHTEVMQNEALYQAIHSVAENSQYESLSAAQKKIIQNDLRDFHLAGVDLPPAQKARFAELQQKLSKLTTQFAENILDATQAWTLNITDKALLAGLPEQAIKTAEENARYKNQEGWTFTLEYPCYSNVMKHLENRELRQKMYEAYVTRASDQGPFAGHYDNTPVIEDILQLRKELAELLGFPSFADFSLATKMADSPKRVLDFLTDLVERAKPIAEKEMAELRNFASALDGLDRLEAWDITYYTEKLRQEKYAISQEELKPYFPVNKVLNGLFTIVNKLYGITIIEMHEMDVWHPQVQCFAIYDNTDNLRGYFYTDLYARAHKRDGAWMDECRMRRYLNNGSLQHPIAYLTCNFARPIGEMPALLNKDEVETLFHEFGHCLHHVLTRVDYAAIAGINGVPWDAVEFPSQLMEHWCWEKETISLLSGHYQTGEPLPNELYQRMVAAKNFQSGMALLRQLELSLFDFRLHLEFDSASDNQAQSLLNEIRNQIAVYTVPKYNRFQQSFSHIFAGGYAAGYYSYKWAEVLSSDAFSLFEETGILNSTTGKSFAENVLETGGLRDPMASFIAFRGREPKIDALLRHNGLE